MYWLWINILLLLLLLPCAGHAVPIVWGAAGHGMETTAGGRGGTVCKVTNLTASGAGSLKACIDATGTRNIVFETSGRIALTTRLEITNGNLSIWGQTAPPPGIMITGAGIRLCADNVYIGHIHLRHGRRGSGGDSMSLRDNFNIDCGSINDVVLDHVSMSWGVDKNAGIFQSNIVRMTVWHSIFGEGLGLSNGLIQDSSSFGILFGTFVNGTPPTNIAVIGNYFHSNYQRNPLVTQGYVANNLIYNHQLNAMHTYVNTDNDFINIASFVGNVSKGGPITNTARKAIRLVLGTNACTSHDIYVSDNIALWDDPSPSDPWDLVEVANCTELQVRNASPQQAVTGYTPHAASLTTTLVKANAGAFPAFRDVVDTRFFTEHDNGSQGSIKHCVVTSECLGGYTQVPEGGYPSYTVNTATFNTPANSTTIVDGYSNLEHYIYDNYTKVIEGLPAPSNLTVEQATPSTVIITVNNPGSSMTPTSGITGWTFTRNGVAWPVSGTCDRPSSNVVECDMSSAAEAGDTLRANYNRLTGNLLNNLSREMAQVINLGITNNVEEAGGGTSNVSIADVFSGGTTASGTFSISTTVDVNDNRLLCVFGGLGEAAANANTISGVTRDGQPFTQVIAASASAGGFDNNVEAWCRVAPNTGTADTVISYTATEPGIKQAVVYSLFNAAQELPQISESNIIIADTLSTITGIVTIVDASLLIDCQNNSLETVTASPGSGQTEDADFATSVMSMSCSHKPATLAGSQSVSQQISSTVNRMSHIVIGVAPFTTSTAFAKISGGNLVGGTW